MAKSDLDRAAVIAIINGGKNLVGVRLDGQDLSGLDFGGVDVNGASFVGCNLQRTRWGQNPKRGQGLVLDPRVRLMGGADFSKADFGGAIFSHGKAEELREILTLAKAKVDGTKFTDEKSARDAALAERLAKAGDAPKRAGFSAVGDM